MNQILMQCLHQPFSEIVVLTTFKCTRRKFAVSDTALGVKLFRLSSNIMAEIF